MHRAATPPPSRSSPRLASSCTLRSPSPRLWLRRNPTHVPSCSSSVAGVAFRYARGWSAPAPSTKVAEPGSPDTRRQPGGAASAAPPAESLTRRQPWGAACVRNEASTPVPTECPPVAADPVDPQADARTATIRPAARIAPRAVTARAVLEVAIAIAGPAEVVAVTIAAAVLGDPRRRCLGGRRGLPAATAAAALGLCGRCLGGRRGRLGADRVGRAVPTALARCATAGRGRHRNSEHYHEQLATHDRHHSL